MAFIRAFFAVELSEEIRGNILAFSSCLKGEFPQIRPVARENMHLTLLFLGTVKENQIKRLIGSINIDWQRRDLSVAGAGFFGSPRSPRIIWAGCRPADKLKAVNEALVKSSKEVGIVPDDREFHPHVTVARIKDKIDGDKLSRFLEGYSDRQFGSTQEARVVLYRSDLSPSGPKYTVLKEFPA